MRFIFYLGLLLLLIVQVTALSLSMPSDPRTIYLGTGQSVSWTYFIGNPTSDPSSLNVGAEAGLLSVKANPVSIDLEPYSAESFSITLTVPEDMKPGIYPIEVFASEKMPENMQGFRAFSSLGDTRTIIVPSEAALILPSVRVNGNLAIVSVSNIGKQALSNVYANAEISGNGQALYSMKSNTVKIPKLSGEVLSLKIPDLSDGVFVLSGLIHSNELQPVPFEHKFAVGDPVYEVSFPSFVSSGDDVKIFANVTLIWSNPVNITNPVLKISSRRRIFSGSGSNMELKPGVNKLAFSGVVLGNQSENCSASLSFDVKGRQKNFAGQVWLEYIPPSIGEVLLENVVSKPYEAVKSSRNLQILLIVFCAMIFSSAFTIVIFKKLERIHSTHEEKTQIPGP